jgi:hypothetical protein
MFMDGVLDRRTATQAFRISDIYIDSLSERNREQALYIQLISPVPDVLRQLPLSEVREGDDALSFVFGNDHEHISLTLRPDNDALETLAEFSVYGSAVVLLGPGRNRRRRYKTTLSAPMLQIIHELALKMNPRPRRPIQFLE